MEHTLRVWSLSFCMVPPPASSLGWVFTCLLPQPLASWLLPCPVTMHAFCSALGRVPCVLPMVSRSEAWRWPLSTKLPMPQCFFIFIFFYGWFDGGKPLALPWSSTWESQGGGWNAVGWGGRPVGRGDAWRCFLVPSEEKHGNPATGRRGLLAASGCMGPQVPVGGSVFTMKVSPFPESATLNSKTKKPSPKPKSKQNLPQKPWQVEERTPKKGTSITF